MLNLKLVGLCPVAYQVLGQDVKVKSVHIRGVVKQNLASALIDDYRIDIVLDRFPGLAANTPLLVYGDATPANFALKNFQNRKRFKILRSIRGHLSSNEGSNPI